MIWRWLAVVLYAALLTVLLLVPDPLFFLRFGAVASPGPVGGLVNDKVLHFCAYAGLGACRRNADCSADAPPFTVGEKYCDEGSCLTVLSGTVCE